MWPDISLDKINDNGGGGLDGVTVSLACPPAIQPGTPRSSVIREPLGHLASADYKGIEQANGSPSDLNKIIDTRHTKRGRNYRDSYTSGTPRGNSFQEGVTICLAPMNPAKICDLHLIRIFKFLNSAAPGGGVERKKRERERTSLVKGRNSRWERLPQLRIRSKAFIDL